jgi:hypothetical protein
MAEVTRVITVRLLSTQSVGAQVQEALNHAGASADDLVSGAVRLSFTWHKEVERRERLVGMLRGGCDGE